MACLHSNLNMTGQDFCPRTSRHRPASFCDHELAVPKRVALSTLQISLHGPEQRKYPTGFSVCSPLHLMYSSLPCDTSSQQCNNDFLKCVERPFPCTFRWSLKLFTAAHILGVKAGLLNSLLPPLFWLLFTVANF